MKMMMSSIILILVASNSFAADILIFKHGVLFDHKGHQSERVGVCTVCHNEPVGKIDGFGKEWAHKNCINCHILLNKGLPDNCGGCHRTMGQKTKSLLAMFLH